MSKGVDALRDALEGLPQGLDGRLGEQRSVEASDPETVLKTKPGGVASLSATFAPCAGRG